MIPKVLGNKVIDKGIDAAVEGGEAEGCNVQGIDVALAPVFNQEIMHHKQKVTRSEADQVHGQDGDNKFDGSLLLLSRVFIYSRRSKCSDHQHIGRGREEGWEQEDPDGQREEIIEHVPHQHLLRQNIMTGGDVQGWNVDGLLHDIQRNGNQQNQQPYSQRDTDGDVCLLPGVHHGVHDDPVSLHAEAGHEENGTVHVAIEKANEYLAKGFPVNPVVAMYVIGNLQREPDNRKEVCQGQVGHVNHSGVPLPGSEKENPQGHAITWQTNHKYNCVDNWKKDSSQLSREDGGRKFIHGEAWFHCNSFPGDVSGAFSLTNEAPSFRESIGSCTRKRGQTRSLQKSPLQQ